MTARLLLLAVLVGATALWLTAAEATPQTQDAQAQLDALPAAIGEWHGKRTPPMTTAVVTELGVDAYVSRIYESPGESPVGVYVGFYGRQRQGDSIHSPAHCLPGAGWIPVDRRLVRIAVGDPGLQGFEANRFIVQKNEDRQLVLYWFQSQRRAVASEYWSKLYMVADAVRFGRTDASLARLVTPIDSSDDGTARAELRARRLAAVVYEHLVRSVFAS